MNLSKKTFALFLLIGLTAGQAQAADSGKKIVIELSTDKVVGATLQLLGKGTNKVIKLLEKEQLSRIVSGLGLSGLCYFVGCKERELAQDGDRGYRHGEAFFWSVLAGIAFTGAAVVGTEIIETIYNA